MYAFTVSTDDGSLLHPLRNVRRPDRRRAGRDDSVGGHHRRVAVGAWATPPAFGASGISEVPKTGFPRIRVLTNGTAFRAPTTRLCGHRSTKPKACGHQSETSRVGAQRSFHPEHIYEARKGEKARQIAELDVDHRRTMEAEITSRAVEFIKRNANAGKPFYAYVSFSLVHMPTLPNPEFAGKTGNGDWADCLAEMDHRTGQILDAIKQAGIEDNTLVVFASDNGPEATDPWEGDSGPWRGTYFTAMEGSLRAPFIIRWPGKVPVGRVNNEIVHIVDLFTTLAHVGGAEVPKDRPIDGIDQLDFFLGRQEASNREGFPAYVADQLAAVKWRNWKAHLIWQENMYAPALKLPLPKVINLLTDLKEERDVAAHNSWVIDPVIRIIGEFEASLKKYPPIPDGHARSVCSAEVDFGRTLRQVSRAPSGPQACPVTLPTRSSRHKWRSENETRQRLVSCLGSGVRFPGLGRGEHPGPHDSRDLGQSARRSRLHRAGLQLHGHAGRLYGRFGRQSLGAAGRTACSRRILGH